MSQGIYRVIKMGLYMGTVSLGALLALVHVQDKGGKYTVVNPKDMVMGEIAFADVPVGDDGDGSDDHDGDGSGGSGY